eukprot:29023-Chlamydomonas_euryale.AAC.5
MFSTQQFSKRLMVPHLEDSASGPTGDLDISNGELPVCTSWSRLLDSFLSSPASLPAGPRACRGQQAFSMLASSGQRVDLEHGFARRGGKTPHSCCLMR